MNSPIKIALYILLAVIASVSGYYALTSFGQLMERSSERHADLERIEPERKPPVEETVPPVTPPATNGAAPGTNAVPLTNIAETNATAPVASVTNAPSPKKAKPEKRASTSGEVNQNKSGGRIGLWTALFVLSVIGLGLMIASDISHFMGTRVLKTLYNEEGEGISNPDYEKAEEVWASGKHLDAISMMREYLQRNPREQHVALRIAEIYEKDLGNFLAAALEYEEVLKHKLPADRWGWAAIHLCNLYFKLNQEQKAYPLLRRIVNEYPTTPAAEKARKRLEQVGEPLVDETTAARTVQPEAAKPTPEAAAPGSSLPPGFKPRK